MNKLQMMAEFRRAVQIFICSLDPEQNKDAILQCASVFPEYEIGKQYKARDLQNGTPADIFRWGYTPMGDAQLYMVLLNHTSAIQWPPDQAVSLYKKIGITNGYYDWVQPYGDVDAYMTGDEVYHNNQIWISTRDYNVSEPGVDGWVVKS